MSELLPGSGSNDLPLNLYINSVSTPEHRQLRDAAVAARDSDRTTVLSEGGTPIAAIVPLQVLAHYEKASRGILTVPELRGQGGTGEPDEN